MEMQIIAIYVICDELTKQCGIKDNRQAQMTTAEIMTSVLVAAELFGGNQTKACRFLKTYGHIRSMLGSSRFNRRLHAISEELWRTLFLALNHILSTTRKKIETTFSCITQRFSRTIHAVLAKGFEIKIIAFIIAHSMNLLFQAG